MEDITGTWRFVSATATGLDGQTLPPPYGNQALGRIVVTPAGRMAVMMIDLRDPLPVGQKREYSGYSGSYTFDGTTLTTHVDCAPDPSRVGTAQARGVRFENNRMILRPPPRGTGASEEQRELTWERISES